MQGSILVGQAARRVSQSFRRLAAGLQSLEDIAQLHTENHQAIEEEIENAKSSLTTFDVETEPVAGLPELISRYTSYHVQVEINNVGHKVRAHVLEFDGERKEQTLANLKEKFGSENVSVVQPTEHDYNVARNAFLFKQLSQYAPQDFPLPVHMEPPERSIKLLVTEKLMEQPEEFKAEKAKEAAPHEKESEGDVVDSGDLSAETAKEAASYEDDSIEDFMDTFDNADMDEKEHQGPPRAGKKKSRKMKK